MGLREWVIVLAIIFMVGLALDAWRRVRKQKRYQGGYTRARSPLAAGQTRRPPDRPAARTEPAFDADTPETGSSSVRVSRVHADDPSSAETKDDAWSESEAEEELDDVLLTSQRAEPEPPAAEPKPKSRSRPRRAARAQQKAKPETAAEQTAPEPQPRPGEKVPMLVDSVESPDESPESDTDARASQYAFDLPDPEPKAPAASADWQDPLFIGTRPEAGAPAQDDEPAAETTAAGDDFDELDDEDFDRAISAETEAEPARRDYTDPKASPFADLYEELAHEPTEFETVSRNAGYNPPSSVDEDDVWDEPDEIDDPVLAAAEARQMNDTEASEQLLAEPEAVLVMTVMAAEDDEFDGTSLLQIMLACGMRFGRMNIFHATDDEGRLQYSAANAFNPGTFDLDDIEHFATRGITFFLQLPCQSDPMEAFDAMYQTATVVATNLRGDLHDDNRSVMTAQTLTHYRERIRDFQRSQLVKRA
ncbi:cell division protein ZipA [Natronospirillum operosum]|uniref:Cell division protein ZipA n=1 Tax=Natronospirillum operosum TaxID=2759953 RepID=A0A4Z0WIU1_9GAMM|nr:cell division protein ZipA [Natronospirillum operosum]TGG95373.1 cell division protein ZipA [Natronospirillum operosum]